MDKLVVKAKAKVEEALETVEGTKTVVLKNTIANSTALIGETVELPAGLADKLVAGGEAEFPAEAE